MKQRWFNYRPLCLVFGFLLLGSVFAFHITEHVLMTIISSIVVAGLFVFIAIWKKRKRYFLIPLISFTVGCGAYFITTYNFKQTVSNVPTSIEARVANISNEKNNLLTVELDSCVFDGKSNNANMILYISDKTGLFQNIHIGSVIKFEPYRFEKTDLFYHGTPNASYIAKDLKFTASVYMTNVTYIKTDKKFAESIREEVKDNLSLGLTNENTEIAYSALFGDKDLLSDKQYNAYKLSGVAHLLAVSGLHVGIIMAALNWLLKLLKVKKWYKLAIVAIVLLFYMYLCGYSISVVRASIMAIVLMIANILGKEHDPMNAISIAGMVIFAINPLCIFDVSFLLSFSCVLGITLLDMSIKAVLMKARISEKVASALSISISTTISIMFIMAHFFGNLNIISIVANMILIPIFTISFTVVFAVSMISLLIPHLCYLIYPVNYIFDFINLTATFLGNLPIANFATIDIGFITILIYFVLLVFLSRFCTAKSTHKAISALPMIAILVWCLV